MKTRKIWEIATTIIMDWKNIYFGARPYLKAMQELDTLDDIYGVDSADYILRYFLANAGTWRGETARATKKEIKAMLGSK